MSTIQFKDPEKHKEEWWNLHPRVRLVTCDLDCWCHDQGIQLFVTEIFRSQEEQTRLFMRGLADDKVSTHTYWRALDVRTFLDPAKCQAAELYINQKYPYGKAGKVTLRFHSGTAFHGHIQVPE